ncbi:MAG: glycosyltransferase family 4 protein [bacterium]|nr:glycosyltransferase family 4 protein [bacterium]
MDRPGWAFHGISRQIVRYLNGRGFQIRAIDCRGEIEVAECDILVCFWWNALPALQERIQYKRLVLCVYDHVSWSYADVDQWAFQRTLSTADVIAVANTQLARELTSGAFDVGDTPIIVTEDGVDTDLFTWTPPPTDRFVVGWAGNSAVGRGLIKGIELVTEACHRIGAHLEVQDASNCGGAALWLMPYWYKAISCYCNASIADGTPNPPLEALASGRPVVSSRVGIMPRAIQHGYNGYLCDRTIPALATALERVRDGDMIALSRAARDSSLDWAWSRKLPSWRRVLETAARRPSKRIAARPVGRKPRGLLVADVRDWAFDVNEQDARHYLADRFELDSYYLIDQVAPPVMSQYDFVFLPYHRWCLDHYWQGRPTLGSLRSRWLDPGNPGKISDTDELFIRRCAAFHTVCQASQDDLARFPNVQYLTNPVNMDRFPKATGARGLIAEWNGNAAHGQEDKLADVKGIHHIIKPACEAARVRLETAEFNKSRIQPQDMGEFYRQATVALCASKYEGASNSVMEAMACGLVVIATDVGNHREMMESQIEHLGATGIVLVERSVEAFTAALQELRDHPQRIREMGQLNRKEIGERWSWEAWRDRYAEFFERAL